MRLRTAAATLLIAVGLGLALWPFVSVARLQQRVLDEVPLPPDTTVVLEGTPRWAIFDDDFVLAYRGVSSSIAEVEATLAANGFAADGPELEGQPTWTRSCCGSYDAVQVRVFEGRDGVTGLRYSVVDDDVTGSWWIVAAIGLAIAGMGTTLAVTVRRSGDSTSGPVGGQTAADLSPTSR